jgi:hypothetical protein
MEIAAVIWEADMTAEMMGLDILIDGKVETKWRCDGCEHIGSFGTPNTKIVSKYMDSLLTIINPIIRRFKMKVVK